MKASTQTTILLKALDLELKALLQHDLRAYHATRIKQQATIKKAA